MKKILYIILMIIFLILASCSQTSIFRMKGPDDFLNKYADNTLSLNNQNNYTEQDIVISGLSKWKKDKYYSKKYGCDYYKRWRSLYDPNINMVNENLLGIKTINSNTPFCSKMENMIYVGKWHYVKKMGKHIRYIACQTDQLHGYFEVMDEKNKNIKCMPLKLKYPIKPFTRESERLNLIKWYDRYGYNAYVDLKTGEIKEAKG